MTWTTAAALTEIRRTARLPAADPTYTDAALFREMDRKINSAIAPEVDAVREGFFVRSKDYTLAANTAEYLLPARAVGDTLIDVLYQEPNGSFRSMAHFLSSERHTLNNSPSGGPIGFVIEGNHLVVVPTPSSAVGTVKVLYATRRGKLVATTDAMQITGIAGNVLSGNAPSAWTTSNTFDLVQDKPGFDTLDIDRAASGVSSATSVTLSSTPPSDLAVGDWVSLSWETPIIQLPLELHDALYSVVAGYICLEIGRTKEAQLFKAEGVEAINRAANLLTPRVKTESKKVTNPNSFIRSGKAYSRWWSDA